MCGAVLCGGSSGGVDRPAIAGGLGAGTPRQRHTSGSNKREMGGSHSDTGRGTTCSLVALALGAAFLALLAGGSINALGAAGLLSRGALEAAPADGGAALAALLRSHAGDLTARAICTRALLRQVDRSVLVISNLWQGGRVSGGASGRAVVRGCMSGWQQGQARGLYCQQQLLEGMPEAQRLFAMQHPSSGTSS